MSLNRLERDLIDESIMREILKFPLERRIAFFLDYDLTLTEQFQQLPYIAKNLDRIKKAYNGKEVINRNTGEKVKINIQTPLDYFVLLNLWSEPHNGISYIDQMLFDAREGILKDFNEETLKKEGANVKLAPGLPEFFTKMKEKWKGQCDIRFFIVSVGIQDFIEGSELVKGGYVDGVYASKLFCIDEFFGFEKTNGRYDAIQELITPFSKTSYAIKIAKGASKKMNDIMRLEDYLYDYRNIFPYVDGTSDISHSAYLRKKGAPVIGVFPRHDFDAFIKVFKNMTLIQRLSALLPRNYSEGSDLWNYTNDQIDLRLNNERCDYSHEHIERYRKRKITNPEQEEEIKDHIKVCKECNSNFNLTWALPERSNNNYANP